MKPRDVSQPRTALDGWQPEHREVDLLRGEHIVMEIAFTTRVAAAHPAEMGKLTVRTTPYSEVFLGTRKLDDTPFADLPLAPGTYTLVFKHPQHVSVIKKVTITAGRTTKLQFALP